MQIVDSEIISPAEEGISRWRFPPHNNSPLYNIGNRLCKRAADLLVSSALILGLLSWLLPLLAVLILLDSPGPVFFLQKRRKRHRELFTCVKLRTMIVNAEADSRSAEREDHRITGVGRWLRRTHLDELPQLLNVWRGDMSLIGPRPYMLSDDDYFERLFPSYTQRCSVKPGITGLAQSWGYFGTPEDPGSLEKRLWLDIRYIRYWSIGMDIRVLLRTLRFLRPSTHKTPVK
jgi:putative colanic acid biosynthesis UDP-glucose lipid carrier transferase